MKFVKPMVCIACLFATVSVVGCGNSAPSEDGGATAQETTAGDASEPTSEDVKDQVIWKVPAATIGKVDDVEKVEFDWGWIKWLMNSEVDPEATMTYGIVRIEAGMSNPLHIHPNCEEYLYVTSGSCEHVLADKTVVLKQGDVIRIPKNVPHKAKALGDEPCDAVIVYDTGTREIVILEEGGQE